MPYLMMMIRNISTAVAFQKKLLEFKSHIILQELVHIAITVNITQDSNSR
jgi:hypothetical protein